MLSKSEKAIVDLAIAILDSHLRNTGAALTSPMVARSFVRLQVETLEQEVFGVIFLDTQHRMLASEILFKGTLDRAIVYPREVAKRALELNCSKFICYHNHPSGWAEPSQADRDITDQLRRALAMLDIGLLDHFVVGKNEMTSFAERGWI
jgi:DNA repair protein RadC